LEGQETDGKNIKEIMKWTDLNWLSIVSLEGFCVYDINVSGSDTGEFVWALHCKCAQNLYISYCIE
jgi:hypothetical protein